MRENAFRLSQSGVVLGFALVALSLTPSLLPRPAFVQGLLSGLLFLFGYLVGFAVGSLARALSRKPAKSRRLLWLLISAAMVILAVPLGFAAVSWQNEIREAVGLPAVSALEPAIFLASFLAVAFVGVGTGELIRYIFGRITAKTNLPIALILSVSAAVVSVLLLGQVARLGTDLIYERINGSPAKGAVRPASVLRSAGPGSAITWEDTGRYGAEFVSGGPGADEIESVTSGDALDPIRVYVGLKSAGTHAERAALAVSELERTGAFDREWILIVFPTGTGVVEPKGVDSVEYLTAGNVATVSTQYSQNSSWISFVFDPDGSVEAARELVAAVSAEILTLPVAERPKLLIYGLSLGAYAGQEIFTSIDDMASRTDGALLIGSPSFSKLVNLPDSVGTEADPLPPNLVFLNNFTDPVSWLSAELVWSQPEWLAGDSRPPGVVRSMRWYPLVTATQVSFDMFVCGSISSCHGHNYGDQILGSWVKIMGDNGLDKAALKEIDEKLKSYESPFFHVELH